MTGALVHAAEPASREVTDWAERLAWTGATLALFVALALLLLRGWRRRVARQADVPALPPVPADRGARLVPAPAEGTYVSTTTAGDWLDRIAARGLGALSAAVVDVTAAGVVIERRGADDVFIPAAQLHDVRLDSGMAGKFVEEGGLVVFTWQLGGHRLDTGFRPRYAADREVVVVAARSLLAGAP